jgi:hypothetical protein
MWTASWKVLELLQDNFGTLYARAKAAKPSARQIRIGLLRVPGTDPDKAMPRAGERISSGSLNEEFLKEWQQAQRDGNLVSGCFVLQQSKNRTRKGDRWRAQLAIWFEMLSFPANIVTKPNGGLQSPDATPGEIPCARRSAS